MLKTKSMLVPLIALALAGGAVMAEPARDTGLSAVAVQSVAAHDLARDVGQVSVYGLQRLALPVPDVGRTPILRSDMRIASAGAVFQGAMDLVLVASESPS
ncbi:hypothetical protein VLF92_12835 [Pseudomonas chengduensis]